MGKHKIDHQKQLEIVIDDIQKTEGAKIKEFVGDNPKRANAKNCLNHASSFPCEYCFCKGVRYEGKSTEKMSKKHFEKIKRTLEAIAEEDETPETQEKIPLIQKELEKAEKNLNTAKKSHIVWPFSTFVAEPRTHENVCAIAEKIERDGKLPPDEAKGVVGRSALTKIENFDMVRDSPTEYLHSVCIGVGKSLVKLTFNVGECWPRTTNRKLSDPLLFNKLMQLLKYPREFSRRIRSLDISVMKGQEYRNIVLFFFPIVIKCIEPNGKERKLWLLFAVMIRSTVLPENEFKNINLQDVYESSQAFYELYEKLFGPRNCVYNTHIVSSHIVDMRFHGPLTVTSAFGFESFYGELRHSFTPGTQSMLKQCFSKVLLKRSISYHYCQNSIYYSNKETNLENNTLIYQFKDLSHKMYKIIEIEDDVLICKQQGRYSYSFPELSKINWSALGVYKQGPLSDEIVKIHKNNVHGKVIPVDDLFITCPNNILREK